MTILFLKGLLIGLLIAAPVGPIALLCMRRTLQDGFRLGFATGMGAAVADAFYGAIAAFGVAAVSDFLTQHQQEFSLGGALVLFILGWRMIVLRKPNDAPDTHPHSYHAAFLSAFILTLTNPITILAFAAMLTMMGVGASASEFRSALILLLGIFLGSALWWGGLSAGVKKVRHLVSDKMLHNINVAAGTGLILFGAYAAASGAKLF